MHPRGVAKTTVSFHISPLSIAFSDAEIAARQSATSWHARAPAASQWVIVCHAITRQKNVLDKGL